MSTNPTDPIVLDLSNLTHAEANAALLEFGRAVQKLSTPETMFTGDPLATLVEAARQVNETLLPLNAPEYKGGPDGPIREPGDDMPSASDIYSDEELCAQLDKHRTRAAKLGIYDMAADLNIARDRLEALIGADDDLKRLSKQYRQLAAEKQVAQNWIENLRAINEAYAATIAEQNLRLEKLGAGYGAVVDAAQSEAIK